MSKNIKGKMDINFNITEAGQFNADVFNAYTDFTLNGVSIVNRITENEGDIAILQTQVEENADEIIELQNTKQDNLFIQQILVPSTTAVASPTAIINYVDGSVPTITATPPLVYSSGTISGTFDLIPTLNSSNFLNSGKIYNALLGKQNTITSATAISCGYLTTSNAVVVNSGSITAVSGNIQAVSGNITTATGSIIAPNIIQNGTNLLTAINNNTTSIDTINTNLANKQELITTTTNIECGLLSSNNLTAREGNIFCLLGDIRAIDGDILTNTGTISTLLGTISAPTIIQDGVNLLNEINTKQDILNIIQTITTSQTAIPSSYAVYNYLDGVYIPQLVSGTAPINYSNSTGVISGTFDLSPTTGSNNFLSSGVISSALSGKQETITSATNINCNFLTTNNIEVLDPGSITTYSGNIQTISGDISTSTGAILQNGVNLLNEINTKQQALVAGEGITLTPNTPLGYTTISTNLATVSTEYGFRVMTNGDSQTVVSPEQIFPFNFINNNGYVIPNLTDFNFTSHTYTIPISGYWFIGYRTYLVGDPTIGTRLSILVNNIVVVQAGGKGSSVEYSATPLYLNTGDEVRVKCSVAGNTFDFRPNMTYFYGYRLQAVNNSVSLTTALDCASLTAVNTISAPSISQNGVNLLDEINTKQDTITSATSISCSYLTTSNAVVVNSGSITAVSGNIQAVSGDISTATGAIIQNGVNLLTEINTKQNQLVAGGGIILNPTGLTTEISVNFPSTQIFTATLSSNITGLGTGTNSLTLPYNNVVIIDGAYNYNPTTGFLTILQSGRYAVSASVNIDNAGYTDRVNLRARLRLNSSWNVGDPQGYGYARHNSYVMYASAVIPEIVRFYTAGDTLDIRVDINKASTTNFTSDFNGIDIFNGCVFSVKSF